ncbi:MAG TPA: aminodeoxychorismate synthase component I [Gemmatimonadales bacterium]|nr:aminodeoxychorismate synthase component I [Gemmatimonadales bacterium]
MGHGGVSIAGPSVTRLDPAPDPLAAFGAVRHLPWPLLLESAGPLTTHSRYSYVMADPVRVVRLPAHPRALDELRSLLAEFRRERIPGLPPFQGGLAGYLTYELGASLEGIETGGDAPGVLMGLYDKVMAWDRVTGECWLMDGRQSTVNGQRSAMNSEQPPADGRLLTVDRRPSTGNITRPAYEAHVQRIRDYILAGDVFQVNLSQCFSMPSTRDTLDLYQRLQSRSAAPFSACFEAGDHDVLSISPELFLSLDGSAIETRPIKGTRPRGATPKADVALAAELQASAKDRAENVMIVDLMRNDLSRVAEPGSVQVPSLCALESHPTVHHLVSTVTATLAPGCDPIDLLAATLPAGSITGAPKVRAMQIIRELEAVPRGVYCGAIGYIGCDGSMKLSVAIRTLARRDGVARIHAGGGVVLDSDPAAEYDETLAKARALLEAATE